MSMYAILCVIINIWNLTTKGCEPHLGLYLSVSASLSVCMSLHQRQERTGAIVRSGSTKATADVGGLRLRCLISNNMSSGLMNLRQC